MSETTRKELLTRGAALGLAAIGIKATGAAGSAVAAPTPKSARDTERLPWQMFNCPAWNEGVLFAFGSSANSAAEIGEVMELVRVVREQTGDPVSPTVGDFDILVRAWQRLAGRLERRATAAAAGGHRVSARQQYLRASSYRAQALFFILGTSTPGREVACFRACEADWLNAIALWDVPVVQSTIPYNGLTMPVYLFRPADDGRARPTVIVCNGSDGQNVDLLAEGIGAALDRGYNAVTIEAPGQMTLLFEQQQVMQSNWAPIISATTAWLGARSDVDASRIAAVGISLLGMVLPSAGTASTGLAAMVLEPGAYSLPAAWTDQRSVKAVQSVLDAPAKYQREVAAGVNAGLRDAWDSMPHVDQFTVSKRSEIYTQTALLCARRGQPPSDYYGVIKAILNFQYQSVLPTVNIPTYVTVNQLDEFFGPQGEKVLGMLTSLTKDQKYRRSLTMATGTQFHDQPLGPQASQEFIFDWLDTVLGV